MDRLEEKMFREALKREWVDGGLRRTLVAFKRGDIDAHEAIDAILEGYTENVEDLPDDV